MELVIKLDDKIYQDIIEGTRQERHSIVVYDFPFTIADAIADGTPLPKGHGRLIDADHFNTDCGIRAVDCPGNCEKCSDCVVKYEDIHNAKTIVEADKENEDEANN